MKLSYHSYLLDGQTSRDMTYAVTPTQLRALAAFMDARGATATHDAQTGLVLSVPDSIEAPSQDEMNIVKALVLKRVKTPLTEEETAVCDALHEKVHQLSNDSWAFTRAAFYDLQRAELETT